ncbi:MAG: elongation factor P [Verrucomicrobiota bacterium]
MAKSNVNDLRVGQAIKWNNDNCILVGKEHRKPGKGPAYMQATLKSLSTGKQLEERFRTSDTVELVNVSTEKWEYSYPEGDSFVFMNLESYENMTLAADLVGPSKDYMTENSEVDLVFIDGRCVGVELPPSVVLEVTESPEGLKGDTATNALKPATLETGVTVQVPLFVKEGDKIKVDPRTGKYTSRA